MVSGLALTDSNSPLLELQNYHILGRILYYVPYHSPLHPGRVLTTFGFISFVVEALNGWGASYSANQSLSTSEIETGHNLIKASLLIQLVVVACFVVLAGVFHVRCSRNGIHNKRLRTPLVTLYVSIGLILVRTIFRTIEYFGVADLRYNDDDFDPNGVSPLIRYEGYFYGFEASLMLINCVMFNVFHPRRYLALNSRIYLAKDTLTEIEGPGYDDPRPFWQTLFDPFDLIGMVRGQKGTQNTKFWEAEAEAGSAASRGGLGSGHVDKGDVESTRPLAESTT